MPIGFWIATTHLGNSALLLPTGVMLALWLYASRHRRLAVAWMLCLGCAALVVLASKLLFLGWGVWVAAIDFTGISGHSMVSTAVFTMAASLLAMHRGPRGRAWALAAGLGIGVLVSVSRLVLQAHSVSEVAAGFLLGALAAVVPFMLVDTARMRMGYRWVPMVLGATLLVVPQMGRPVESHELVVKLALLASGRSEVFRRDVMHR